MRVGASDKYLNKTFVNKHGEYATVVSYKSAMSMTIRYENGYEQEVQGSNLLRGNFKSPYTPTHCGRGYIGEGRHNPSKNGVKTNIYKVWCGILERCYGKKSTLSERGYASTMCDEWLNYQLFADWYEENYYEVGDERMCVDKDILIKGNTLYSPSTCCIVPNSINCLLIGSDAKRGAYPIGVSYKQGEGFYSRCNIAKNKTVYLGTYNTPEEAFLVYKTYKEKTIKERASELRDVLPSNVITALYSYEVEMND